MKGNILEIKFNTKKTVLSSKGLFYKTENFINSSKYISNIDMLLTKFGESVFLNLGKILHNEKTNISEIECFQISTKDKLFACYFKFGYQISDELNSHDIVFFEIENNDDGVRQTIERYFADIEEVDVIIIKEKKLVKLSDFVKLYLISNSSGINLPRLSEEQKALVETIDKNVLVQGVAGSGKTNICIDKIIFTACKNYTGKLLYTTFNRGLLLDIKLKVERYKQDLISMLDAYQKNNIVFLDNNHKKALENRLGIYFFGDDDNQIFNKLERVIFYLTNRVEYMLIEDIFKRKFGNNFIFVNENYFVNDYCNNLSNYHIEKCFSKLSKYSKELIYKEIYGMILGACKNNNVSDILTLDEYKLSRSDDFSVEECENIYKIALDYLKQCKSKNLIDNNIASREILNNIDSDFEYSLVIIDEVQDYTQINLNLFKKLSLKMFCVGDALQMINPACFNFGYLKNLLYKEDVTDIKELKFNYRNTAKIASVIEDLGAVNKEQFGTHNFVLHGEAIDSSIDSEVVYLNSDDFIDKIAKSNFDNFTIIVASDNDKKDLQRVLTNQEVLTVSEIKGLERNTVVAYNLLSSNVEKWNSLERKILNHKKADENSVYRYYYNLFYVGVSRAKQNLFVVESSKINQFVKFFQKNFVISNSAQAIKKLEDIVSKVEFTQFEVKERVSEFVRLGQYENARFTAMKIQDDVERNNILKTIEISEKYIQHGEYRDAGIKFWEYGLIDSAREQFLLSGDAPLIELMNSCLSNNSENLNIDIINYYLDVSENDFAKSFILDTVKNDVDNLKTKFKEIKDNFKKGGVYGK